MPNPSRLLFKKNVRIQPFTGKNEAILPKNEGIANEISILAGQERLKSVGKIDGHFFQKREDVGWKGMGLSSETRR
jgi:hypothetical protein